MMPKRPSSSGKSRLLAGTILITLSSVLLIGSSMAKFAHVNKVVTDLGQFGFTNSKFTLIAILELLGALTFLVRSTRSFGLLFLSAYMGGAIATHIQHDTPFIQPAVILTVIWLGAALRHPEVFWSLNAASSSGENALMTSQDVLGS
jgi:hypothetical protein